MTDWRLRMLGLLAATLALAVPASASGAMTIGSNLEGTASNGTGCLMGGPCTSSQQALPASATASGGLTAPNDGVVVRWRIKVGVATSAVALRIVRRPDPLLTTSTSAGTGPTVTPGANQTSTFDVRLPILAGDAVGVDNGGLSAESPTPGATSVLWDPPLIDNAPPRAPNGTGNGFQLLVNADIELDCDNDGFGDETQDTNLSTCAPGTIPPPAKGGPTCKGKPATIVGTNGRDARTGSQGRDVFVGLGGSDKLSGKAGNDLVCGGGGKDTLKGGKGKDSLLGQKGKDTLGGGKGKEICWGSKGNDTASKCEVEKSL